MTAETRLFTTRPAGRYTTMPMVLGLGAMQIALIGTASHTALTATDFLVVA